MVDTPNLVSDLGPFETLQQQAAHTRRLRPTDLNISATDEHRIPLKAEKLSRRESRLGLSRIFGRPKAPSEEDVVVPRDIPSRSGGIRASLAEFSNWPYGLSGHKSEITLPFLRESPQATSKSPPTSDHLKHKKSASAVKVQPSPKPTQRAAWDPPPLFQAYPQAIRHIQLPACKTSTETILRLHGQKGNASLGDVLNPGAVTTDDPDDLPGEKGLKVPKRRHRRSTSASSLKGDWTTKIYVLVTSGYLLQYAGDGSFDRLPEKMLHLGKESAAFASDVIPGRHWVLQVTSVTDPDGLPAPHSTSLFSRLPFRVTEKRQASTFLMVFESAEDMEGWITILRREIEALGGKKNLSETGKPKVDDNVLQLKAQPSQRTLVVRDPDRFSKVLPQGISWDQPATASNPDIQLSSVDSDADRDQSFDDTSTASGISQDGRQLDGLRDSTHRLSYMSSGQRTVITSAGSSPACSPIRDSFGSQLEELPSRELPQEIQAWPRPRPNAAAILDRRQSMQSVNHLAEMRVASSAPRPFSTTYSGSWQSLSPTPHKATSPPTIPNFSVPQSVSKRYSLAARPPQELPPSAFSQQGMGAVRPSRRPPPTAISINPRPLSLVVDQPSPDSQSPGSLNKQLMTPEEMTAPDTPSMFSSWGQDNTQVDICDYSDTASPPLRDSVFADDDTAEVKMHPRPRRHTSSNTIRTSVTMTETEVETSTIVIPNHVPVRPETHMMSASYPSQSPRSRSSLDSYGRSKSPPLSFPSSQFKRFSLYSPSSDAMSQHSATDSEVAITITSLSPHDSSIRAHTPTLFKSPMSNPRASMSSQHLAVDPISKGLFGRRSMSRLADIPPPAPPPTCALPPLPPPRKAP